MKDPQLDFDIEELSNCTNDTFKVDFEINAIVETDDVVVCCIVCAVIEIVGNGLLTLMIIHEKFCMDPKKRTAINQLMTYMCIWLILHNLVGAPLMTYSIYVKDTGKNYLPISVLAISKFLLHLGHEIAHFQILATTGITYFCSISLAQITILRCLYINNWGRMVMVDDDFIARICYQFNILICTMFTIIKADLEQYHGNYHYLAARNLFGLQGGPFDQKTYKRISFW